MHTFVVVCARPGHRVPDHVRRVLDAAAPAELTFAPDDHVHWSDDADALHFAGWQAGGPNLGVGSRWEVRPSGVTAFSGHPWLDAEPWKPGKNWAAQLADRLTDIELAPLATRLDGVFNLVHLGADGHGGITGDPLGVGLTYEGHSTEITVFSNRASLVARLIAPEGHDPARDVEGAVWLAYANNLQTKGTTFVGVSPIPRASVTTLAPGANPANRQWAHTPWIDPGLAEVADSPEVYRAAIEHLRALTRLMAELPSPLRTLELTGGQDSRMILSLLLAEGVAADFAYVTWGTADLPDVVVANQLADRFDLDLRVQGRPRRHRSRPRRPQDPPAPVVEPAAAAREVPAPLGFDAELRRHVWRTSGAVSVWEPSINGRTPSPGIALTGQFGELLRTNYPRTTGIASVGDMDRYVRAGAFGFDAAALLRPSVRRHYDDMVVRQLHDLLPPGGVAQDAIDGYNQVARLRRWFGTSHELDNRNRLFPLYSMPATQAAFAIGSRRRRQEALPFEVIRATCPELALIPFAPADWPASLVADLPDGHRYPTSPDVAPWVPPSWLEQRRSRRPRRSRQSAPRLAAEERTMRDIETKIPVLRDHLDLGPTHELYRYLDYDATMQAVTDLAEQNFLVRRSIHDAVTAAMWLGRAETPESF